MNGKHKSILIIIISILVGGTALYFDFIALKEKEYQERYPEFYYIEEYLDELEKETDLCDALRYDLDGTEIYFSKWKGFEEGYEHYIHTQIRPKLETERYSIRYYITYVHEKDRRAWFGDFRQLHVTFDVYNEEGEVQMQNYMKYRYKNVQYTEIVKDKDSNLISSEFDEESREIYNLIIEDIVNRIGQCKVDS